MKCKVCNKEPKDIEEYVVAAKIHNTTPEEYVKNEEATYNPKTKKFFCTTCYIKVGMPSGKA